jgi:cysteine synthase
MDLIKLKELGMFDRHVPLATAHRTLSYDFTPDVLSREPGLINDWVKVRDSECFKSTRDTMRMEGLLVGGSSGAAVAATLSWLTAAPGRDVEGQNVVIILPDGYVRAASSAFPFCSDHSCFYFE